MVPATHIFPMKVMSGECQKGGHKTFNESKSNLISCKTVCYNKK